MSNRFDISVIFHIRTRTGFLIFDSGKGRGFLIQDRRSACTSARHGKLIFGGGRSRGVFYSGRMGNVVVGNSSHDSGLFGEARSALGKKLHGIRVWVCRDCLITSYPSDLTVTVANKRAGYLDFVKLLFAVVSSRT